MLQLHDERSLSADYDFRGADGKININRCDEKHPPAEDVFSGRIVFKKKVRPA